MKGKNEQTLVIIKPDGVQRSYLGEIITRFERTGLKLVSLKMELGSLEKLKTHYNKDDEWYEAKGANLVKILEAKGETPEKSAIEYGKDIIRALIKYMSSGPVVVMVWEGNKSVDIVKKLVGSTEPSTSEVGTIRGDLTLDSYDLSNYDGRAVRNLVHCSESQEEAQREISIWVKQDDIINYRHIQSQMLYDVNLDGILE